MAESSLKRGIPTNLANGIVNTWGLKSTEGVEVDAKLEESEFGKFGWVMDPEGSRVELWEPPSPAK